MSFELDITERVTRVEDGVEYLKSGIDDIREFIKQPCDVSKCAMRDHVEDLRKTQKWVRYVSKTAIGGSILALISVIAKVMFNYGAS